MNKRRPTAALALTTAALGTGWITATPAAAGGVGAFVSPSFGTTCLNRHQSLAAGDAAASGGSASGNLAGLPFGSPFNQCGGADHPDSDVSRDVDPDHDTDVNGDADAGIGIFGSSRQ